MTHKVVTPVYLGKEYAAVIACALFRKRNWI